MEEEIKNLILFAVSILSIANAWWFLQLQKELYKQKILK